VLIFLIFSTQSYYKHREQMKGVKLPTVISKSLQNTSRPTVYFCERNFLYCLISIQKQNTRTKTELYEHVSKNLKIKFTKGKKSCIPELLRNIREIHSKQDALLTKYKLLTYAESQRMYMISTICNRKYSKSLG
jgi:hypothetical protein